MIMNAHTQTDLALLIPEVWAQRLVQATIAQNFWERFTGVQGSGMPVIRKTELITQPGGTIHISQIANIGGGVTGNTQLIGSEVKTTPRQVSLSPVWHRNGMAILDPAMKQITFNFREEALMALSKWMAAEQDTTMWTAARLTGNVGFEAAPVQTIYGGNATTDDELDAADVMTVALIRKASAILMDNNRDMIRTQDMPAGQEYYVMFINAAQAYNLKNDTEWQEAQASANIRGATNPLFTGALGEIDGVIVYQTGQCTSRLNAHATPILIADAVVMSAECMAQAVNQEVRWDEETKDYRFEFGIGVGAAWENKILSSEGLVKVTTAAVMPT